MLNLARDSSRRSTVLRLGVVLATIAAGMLAPALPGPAAATTATSTPAISHVFVIVMENENEAATFASDPYLKSLAASGAFIPNYYGTGHESNDNYIAMVSGQGPNPQTQGDCPIFDDFVGTGPLPSVPVFPGQAVGTGCVYPSSVPTIADQLGAAHKSWKGYMEDMGNLPSREPATCGHPALNSQDNTEQAVAGDGYATRHDPFVYFHSIIDSPSCAQNVVPLGSATGTTGLAADLTSGNVPNVAFIVPNLCNDGHDYPCVNQPSPSTSAVGDIDVFLQTWLPKIAASPAYGHSAVAIVFDEAQGPPSGDSSACCGETPGPNSPLPGITGLGGGKTGALLLSPHLRKGTTSAVSYNHYSLLASLEDLYGLPRLGYAQTSPNVFWSDPAIQ